MKLKKLFRAMSASDMPVDPEKRTVEFPFSSEAPVQRYFGNEILSHKAGCVDLSRAAAGAMPLLFNHDMNDIRGVIESVKMGADNRLYAVARFAKTPAGDEMMSMIQDGNYA